MDHHQNHYHRPPDKKPWWQTSSGMLLIVLFAVGGYFLIKEHAAHIGENWILLILLLCPLMHIFMHGGHGRHEDHGEDHHRHSDDEKET